MRFYFEHLWMAISSSENRRNVRREVQCDGVTLSYSLYIRHADVN